MNKVKYLAFFVPEEKANSRNITPSSNAKVDYLIEALNNSNFEVELFSACSSRGKTQKKETFKINNNIFHLFFSQYSNNKLIRGFFNKLFKIRLYLELKKNLSKCDTLVVYHSLYYMKMVRKLKQKIGFKLILEIEEIYSDVTNDSNTKKKELAYFQIADAFFFSTEMLNESINKTSKPYVVNYGTYRVEEIIKSKFDDGLIHCVYAGTLDPKKGGCAASIAAAEFLPEGYHIHILGFGNDDYIKKTNDLIDEISLKTKCQITYDGLKSGKEYLSFLQSCHIGLSTQNPDASFNATSFPSKVLSYLSNGLHVVTVDVPSISNSKVGAILTYYKKQDPREIANAIRSIDINQKYNPREFLSNLANEFERELSILMRAITGNVK